MGVSKIGKRKTNKTLNSADGKLELEKARDKLIDEMFYIFAYKVPGLYLITYPCGIGKSYIATEMIAEMIDEHDYLNKVLFLGERHEQINQFRLQVKQYYPEVEIVQLKGKDKIKGFKCYKKKHQSGYYSCKGCSKWNCDYPKQFREAKKSKLVFGVFQHLSFLPEIQPQILILDENFLKQSPITFRRNDLIHTIDFLLEINEIDTDFIELLADLVDCQDYLDFSEVINDRTYYVQNISSKVLENVQNQYLKVYPEGKPKERFVLFEVIELFKNILRLKEQMGTEAIRRVGLYRHNNEYSFIPWYDLPSDIPVVIFDATGRKEFYELVLDREINHISCPQVQQQSRIIPIIHDQYLKSHLGNSGTNKRKLDEVIEIINNLITAHKYMNVGIISYKKIMPILKQEIFHSKQFGHFFGLRGENTFIDCDAVFVLGWPQITAEQVARKAFSLFRLDLPLEDLIEECIQAYTKPELHDWAKNDKYKLLRNSYPLTGVRIREKHCSLVYDAFCTSEFIQAVGRARPYDERETPQDIYIMTTADFRNEYEYEDPISIQKTQTKETPWNFQGQTLNNIMLLIGEAQKRGMLAGPKKPTIHQWEELKEILGISMSRKTIQKFRPYINLLLKQL